MNREKNPNIQKVEESDVSKPESVPKLPADYVENDPRYKEMFQLASIDHLKSASSADYMRRQGYSWTPEGKITDREGNDVIPSTLVGPANIREVQDSARREFSERYEKDLGAYDDREKVRIYDSPSSDPAYSETEREISRQANENGSRWNNMSNGLGDRSRIQDRERELVSIAHWGTFASKYPEKAAVYAEKNEFLAKALTEQQNKEKYYEDLKRNQQEKLKIGIGSAQNIQELIGAMEQVDSIQGSKKEYKTRELAQKIREVSSLVWAHIKPGQNGKLFEGPNPMILEDITRTFGLRDRVRELIEKEYEERSKKASEKSVERELAKKEGQRRIDEIMASLGVEKHSLKIRSEDDESEIIGHDVKIPEESVGLEDVRQESMSQSEVQAEAVQAKEILLTKEDVVSQYLSYQDMPVNADEKRNMLEYSLTSESADKYAESLEELLADNSKERVEDIAKAIKQKAKDIVKKVGISGSSFLDSMTWAMWDIGKQYYYFTHKDEADPNYTIANPLQSIEKVSEIVDRHVGWEAYRSKDKSFADKYKKHPKFAKLQELLNKQSKPTSGDLSSKDLAILGGLLKEMANA